MKISKSSLDLLRIYSFVFLALAIYGTYLNYSFIPVADSWSNYELFKEVGEGHYLSFLSLHNEHRIVPSKLLFWIDMKFFNGTEKFLLIIHYLLVSIIIILFCKINILVNNPSKKLTTLFGCIVIIMSFFWVQRANLTWAFQSQFYFVILFSLLTFVSIRHSLPIITTTIFIILSMFSMGNGILIPLLVFIYYLLNKKYKTAILSLFLFLILFLLYFQNYVSSSNYMSPIDSLINHPFRIVIFSLVFLGNIFSSLVGKGIFGSVIAGLMGLFSVFLVATSFKKQIKNPFFYFLLFIIGTAVLTAMGRQEDGFIHAVSSRYTTPAVFYWIMIVVLYSQKLGNLNDKTKNLIKKVLVFVLLTAFLVQLKAFRSIEGKMQKRFIDLSILINNHGDILPHINYDLMQSDLIKDNFIFSNKLALKGKIPNFKIQDHSCKPKVLANKFTEGKSQSYKYLQLTFAEPLNADLLYLYNHNVPVGLITSKNLFKKRFSLTKIENTKTLYGYLVNTDLHSDNYQIVDYENKCHFDLDIN